MLPKAHSVTFQQPLQLVVSLCNFLRDLLRFQLLSHISHCTMSMVGDYCCLLLLLLLLLAYGLTTPGRRNPLNHYSSAASHPSSKLNGSLYVVALTQFHTENSTYRRIITITIPSDTPSTVAVQLFTGQPEIRRNCREL